jgi:hypothetical protein
LADDYVGYGTDEYPLPRHLRQIQIKLVNNCDSSVKRDEDIYGVHGPALNKILRTLTYEHNEDQTDSIPNHKSLLVNTMHTINNGLQENLATEIREKLSAGDADENILARPAVIFVHNQVKERTIHLTDMLTRKLETVFKRVGKDLETGMKEIAESVVEEEARAARKGDETNWFDYDEEENTVTMQIRPKFRFIQTWYDFAYLLFQR